MLNTAEIIQRIQQLINDHELNASSFAEKIGVQRSSISHILSGRNKPSLDFLARIEKSFDDVDFLWLLKGESSTTPSPTVERKKEQAETTPATSHGLDQQSPSKTPAASIEKIVHYYADGSFEVFHKR